MKVIVFALVSFLHDLFSVVWMGGLIVSAISLLPAVKEALGAGPQVKKVMAAFQKRQSLWVYISMAGLILTGLMMGNRSPEFQGLFHFGNSYAIALSIKHILVIVMIGLTLYRSLILGKRAKPMTPEKERLNLKLLLANAVLAMLVLLISGFVAALARPLATG